MLHYFNVITFHYALDAVALFVIGIVIVALLNIALS